MSKQRRAVPDSAAGDRGSDELEDSIAQHVDWAVRTWPQIDPDVEGVVSRLDKINRYLQAAFRASLGEVGLTKEEWKVVMALHAGTRSHGWLCRDLDVSTGVMTNRLDKLERRGLLERSPDPEDRRGVRLELTEAGSALLEDYINAGVAREGELLSDLTRAEKKELNQLLSKLLVSLQKRGGDLRSGPGGRRPA